MRFRLGINGTGAQQAGAGIANGFRALSMLPMLQAQAADEAQTADMRRQLFGAQIAEHQAKADAERSQLERGSMGELLKNAALQNGVPLAQLDEATNYFQTGKLPGQYELPAGQQGPILPKPQYADPTVGQRIFNTLGLTRQALAMGDQNIEHLAKAGGEYQKQDDVRRLQADPSAAGRAGQAYAAVEGKPLVDAIGNTGVGYNRFTGEGGTMDQGLRALYGDVQGANILRDKAGAAASYASAEHSRAGTRKINQEIEQGQRSGNLQVVTGPDGTVTVVDKVNRTAQPVLGADGKPIVKGAAGGGGKPMTEAQAKANLFGGRMTESDKILNELEGKYSPAAVATKMAMGEVPGIGGMLGAIGNAALSDEGQRAEQAQRDFINAVLRRESGAVISKEEFSNAQKQYFPEPNDTPGKLEQKRRNRQIATTLMLQEVPEAQRYRQGQVPIPEPAGAPAGPRKIASDAEYAALPSGSVFIGPDGKQRRKP